MDHHHHNLPAEYIPGEPSGGLCHIKNSSPPKNLQELIEQLHEVFESDHVNVEYVQALMTSYQTNEKDWKRYAKFDQHRYTRNLVDQGNGKFDLILLCWNEGQGSSIHDHANAHCFMKVLNGQLNEDLFDWPEKEGAEMRHRCTNEYELNSCAYICDQIGLHRVENPSFTDKAVSLHLYSPPFHACNCFDQRTGHKVTSKVTFWSKFGERIPWHPPFNSTPSGNAIISSRGENENN